MFQTALMELIQQSQCYIQVSYNASLSGLGGRVGSLQQGRSTAQPQALPRVPSCLLRSFTHTHPPPPNQDSQWAHSTLLQTSPRALPSLCHLQGRNPSPTSQGLFFWERERERERGCFRHCTESSRQNVLKGITSEFSKREFYFHCATETRHFEI